MFAASKSGSAVAKDPQFNYVTMLLHGDGTNGAQNNTFLDSSTNNFTITRNGNTTQGTFTPYGSNWSNYFDGSSAKITLSSSTAMNLDAQFTIECWVYWNGTSLYYQNFVGSNDTFTSNASFFRVWGTSAPVNANKIGIGNPTHDGSSSVFSTNNLVANQWNHVAATRDSSNIIRVFINGTLEKTGSTDSSVYNFGQGGTCIGDSPWDGAQGWYSGYISNLRIIKGSCLYTSSFTPSTTPLTAVTNTSLLVCQSNRFIDNSSNAYALTASGSPSVQRFSPFSPTTAYSTSVIGGSGYFDGSGDYLRVAYNSNLYPTTTGTDYTVECWVYPTSGVGSYTYILGTNNTSVADWQITNEGGTWSFTLSGVGTNAGTVIGNMWSHLAMTRSGTTVNAYLNGVRVYTATALTQSNNNLPVNIGMRNGSDRAFNGYITDIRIVNGTALYTGASYTVPTTPETAITNTQLLLSNTNAGILDNAMMNDLETVGNAQISTSVKKYGTGSLAFDGTGDWLVTPYNPNWILSGDFTIELWLYWTAHGSYGGIVGCANSNTGSAISAGWFLDFNSSSNNLQFEGQGGVSVVTTNVIPSSQWVHIAVVRSGSTITHYLNGVANGSGTSSTSFNSSTFPLYVGVDRGGSSTLTGYIDDLRITKGFARYTANFTPPTAAFPNN